MAGRTPATLVLVTLIALPVLAQTPIKPPGAGAEPVDVPTSLFVDPCRYHTQEGLVTSEVALFDLPLDGTWSEDAWATTAEGTYRGVAWATHPTYERSYLFMSRGPYLEIYDLDEPISDIDDPFVEAYIGIVDVGALVDIPDLEIGRIAAGGYKPFVIEPGVVVGVSTVYLIARSGSTAYLIVIDQQWLIEGQSPTSTIVYGVEELCQYGGCTSVDVVDLAVGDLADSTYSEEAYATVIQDFSGTELAMTYRIERSLEGDDFTVTALFAYLWGGYEVERSSGIAFADGSHDAYVVRKPGYVRNLVDHSESCELAGEPTDIAVWEPGISTSVPRYLFVTTSDGDDGRIEVLPAAPCAAGGAPVFEMATARHPTSLSIYEIDNNEAMIVVSSEGGVPGEGYFEAFRVKVTSPGGVDTFALMNTWSRHTGYHGWFQQTCPSETTVGVRRGLVPHGTPVGLDRNCLPSDPRCPN